MSQPRKAHLSGGGKVATLGYCWGGTISWRAAATLDGIAAAVCYYAHADRAVSSEKPRCPVLMHFGDKRSDRDARACRRAACGAGCAGRNSGLSGRSRLQLRRNAELSRAERGPGVCDVHLNFCLPTSGNLLGKEQMLP